MRHNRLVNHFGGRSLRPGGAQGLPVGVRCVRATPRIPDSDRVGEGKAHVQHLVENRDAVKREVGVGQESGKDSRA